MRSTNTQTNSRFRGLLWTLHRWIGIVLFVLIAPIAFSGALLVFHDELDVVLNSQRYAVSGNATLAPSAYLASAATALDDTLRPASVRYPEHPGAPVTVQARGPRVEGSPPRLLIVYLDPPTARVLEVVDYRSSLFGFLHRFHENLAVPDWSGQAIVGWVGVGLFVLALSGILLWWPRNVAFVRGLRWGRRPAVTTNLHFVIGFWISLPLAFVALTGIYLAFPPQARSLMSSVAPMNPPPARDFSAPLQKTAIDPDRAAEIARDAAPGANLVALFLPTAGRGEGAQPTWRAQFASAAGDLTTIVINDRSAEARRQAAPQTGDSAAQWIRWLHEGSNSGPVWRLVVLFTGLAPPVLGVTGIIMWLRGRRNRSIAASTSAGALQAAE